jgi:cytochrome c oxidase subunit 2
MTSITSLFNLAQPLSAPVTPSQLPKIPESPYFWMPTDSSLTVQNVDWIYDFMVWMSAISAAGILGAMVYFCVKYKAKSRKANEIPEKSSEHNTTLEITWSIIPMFITVALFVWGFRGYVDLRTAPQGAMELRANGQKWKWTFTYPGGLVDDTLHVPVDTPVRIVITASDVLHSLFIPDFRVKMDAVPGRYTELWFHATRTGEFPIYCTEYCGTNHSDMLARVIVHPKGGKEVKGSYEHWIEQTNAKLLDMPPIELGKLLYEKQGCSTCHTLDGTIKIGPSWKGVFGKQNSFVDGSSALVDENYIRESINNPQAKIVQGFAPAMPSYQGKLKDRELDGIIAYIKSLK